MRTTFSFKEQQVFHDILKTVTDEALDKLTSKVPINNVVTICERTGDIVLSEMDKAIREFFDDDEVVKAMSDIVLCSMGWAAARHKVPGRPQDYEED